MRTERDTRGRSSFSMETGMNTNIYSIVPLMRTLVIRFTNYPDWFGPSGKNFLTAILLGLLWLYNIMQRNEHFIN
jgi:hypothetical protein